MTVKTSSFARIPLTGVVAMLSAGCGEGRESDGNTFGVPTSGVTAGADGATDSSAPATGGETQGPDDGTGIDATGESGADADAGFLFDLGAPADLGDGGGVIGDGCQYLDILFVVDISGSMSEEKQNLADNFPSFVQVLDDYIADPTKGALGYRLGTTNSSFQSDGSTTGLDGALFDDGGGCGTAGNPWIDGPGPGISANFDCLANDPKACTNSCADLGRERPLDTIEAFAALHAPGQANAGFYRGEESLLVIVTLTDEDDHSEPTPPLQVKAALDAFAGGEDRYVVVTIAGPQNQGCESAFGEASSAPRLHDFTGLVPNGSMGDICLGDLSTSLADALDLIQVACDTLPPPAG